MLAQVPRVRFKSDSHSHKVDEIEEDSQSAFGSAIVRGIMVENKGAGIGPYLRQLQVLGPRATVK